MSDRFVPCGGSTTSRTGGRTEYRPLSDLLQYNGFQLSAMTYPTVHMFSVSRRVIHVPRVAHRVSTIRKRHHSFFFDTRRAFQPGRYSAINAFSKRNRYSSVSSAGRQLY